MANFATTWTMTHPSYVEPGIILQINQASGAFDLLATGNPLVRLGSEDKQIYVKKLEVRHKTIATAGNANFIPSASLVPSWISAPTYSILSRAEYNHHETAMMGQWGINIVDAYRLANRQGHFQTLRNFALYGNLPANGEGLVNAAGATSVNLPPDTNGSDSARTYDNGQMGQFFLSQLLATKTRAYQLGLPVRFSVVGPQRILGQFEYPNIVQLTSYQRPGAGSTTTVGMIKDVSGLNGDIIEWSYDDTLQGQGAGGTDMVIISMPEVKKPAGRINTNAFAELAPGLQACTVMYTDMPAPMEIPTPLPGGAIDVQFEMRSSTGWALRPEGLTLISMTY